ncbi:Fe-S cluster assembly protein SufD [Roseiarcus sp.]|jgi:Fe-S cluster assembly protein SufD|uniref:Fe-S cluster assembly protein SufD n=1 Tax=Roseiarcus sp. TaxID=1969460 RepID=UPI003D138ECD
MNAHVVNRSAAEKTLFRQFAEQQARSPSPVRAAAFARFAEAGLPTRRVEAWHYTDLRAAMADAAPVLAAPTPADIKAARLRLARRERFAPGAQLVLLGGRYIGELSDRLPDGVTVTEGAVLAVPVADPLAALNEALSPSGCTISVARGAEIAEPITILHLADGMSDYSVYSRSAIALNAGARASFVEVFEGAQARVQRHSATIMTLAKGAKARHVAVVGDEPGLHIETHVCDLAENAELEAFGLISGGDLTRRQIFVRMTGDEAKVSLGGLALIDGDRRADTTLQVVHAAPRGTSREFYRAIVDDDAIGVFQGKIIVERAAQKTDGAMKSQAILLSPRAQMNEKPELEIFADDVVCGHGATVASLDPEQVFYLRSRGIPESDAKAMLLEAFGGESIDRIEDELLIEALRARLRAWLGSRM